tara:strand:+ start:245 stop:496 length:252 start_codon:yes stop_codon:yes gene_type:complete
MTETNAQATPGIPNRIADLRKQSRLTQKEVAKLLDLSHSLVAKHEAGTRTVTPEDIQKYSQLFKVASYELFMDPAAMHGQASQ